MNDPLKILFFYQYFGTPKGGWSTRVYELTRRWVTEGHEVTVVTAPYDKSDIRPDGFISRQEIEGVKLIVINSGDSNRLPVSVRAFRALRFAGMSSFYALFRSYDVLIASSGPITIGVPMILAKLIRRKKTVFEVRDLWPAGGIELGLIKKVWQQKLSLWFEKQCYTKANLVVTASVGQKEHIGKRFPCRLVEVIPNASDLDVFGVPSTESLPAWASQKKLFTHIGSLGLIHNVEYWIKVASEISALDSDGKIHFVFIGDGVERQDLERKLTELQLTNMIFLGLKPKTELSTWVQNSEATLFATLDNPSQNTCSPNKIFDSFAAGVPIVQTSTGWIFDLVKAEFCGINVSLYDPPAAAMRIVELSKNRHQREELSANAKRLAETTFNRDVLSEKYLASIIRLFK